MSLKAFHLFFIVVSILLSTFFGVWCVQNSMGALWSIGSFAISAGLLTYLLWFLKKTKQIGFLALGALISLSFSNSALACSVCFGNPNAPLSPMAQSANTAMLFMLVLVGIVLSGFGGLFLYWMAKAKRLGL